MDPDVFNIEAEMLQRTPCIDATELYKLPLSLGMYFLSQEQLVFTHQPVDLLVVNDIPPFPQFICSLVVSVGCIGSRENGFNFLDDCFIAHHLTLTEGRRTGFYATWARMWLVIETTARIIHPGT